jgi:hypothetical protein
VLQNPNLSTRTSWQQKKTVRLLKQFECIQANKTQ